MKSVKTAISIDADLFARGERLAHEMKVSRSRLYQLSLGEFLRQRRNDQLTVSINAAYDKSPPDEEDRQWLEFGRRSMARVLADDTW